MGEVGPVAAIDIGSNAMRMAIGVGGRGGDPAVEQIDYVRAPVRLGHAAFVTGRLTDENLQAAGEALELFRRRMDGHGVARHRAVATSAVRDASNGGDLVALARSRAGIEIEVIGGGEEARLVWVAVRERLDVEGRWLLVDLGGGSLEVSVVGPDGIEDTGTHPLGTVRILERLEADGGGIEELIAEVADRIRVPAPSTLQGLIATGGNIEALASLAGCEPEADGASRLPVDAMTRAMARVESMTYEERVGDLGLRRDRADVIVPAGRIYRWVAERAGAAEIVVPNLGVSDGILLELSRG